MRLMIDAHELGDFEIVRGGAEGAADRRAVEDEVEEHDHGDRGQQRQQRHDADRNAAAERDRRGLDRPGAQALAVGGEELQQPVLDDDRQTESHEQRRQQIAPERPVQQHVLKRKADDEQDRDRRQHRDEGIEAELARDDKIAKAASTMRSPWARLTSRITPNISDSPAANRA